MDFEEINDLILLKQRPVLDKRGEFQKYWTGDYLNDRLEGEKIRECYITKSKRNVIRGMHYQAGIDSHHKIVTCVQGSCLDVVIDIRRTSKTFGTVYSFVLSPNKISGLFIPRGYAHGFKALEDNTQLIYNVTTDYSPENDKGINFLSIGFDWGEFDYELISDRDKALPDFAKCNLYL